MGLFERRSMVAAATSTIISKGVNASHQLSAFLLSG
jgi:hypothetical protein